MTDRQEPQAHADATPSDRSAIIETARPTSASCNGAGGTQRAAATVDGIRGQNEAVLQQAALLDLAYDTIIVHNLETRALLWNRAAEQMYGWSREEAVGHFVGELLQTRYPESMDATLSALRA